MVASCLPLSWARARALADDDAAAAAAARAQRVAAYSELVAAGGASDELLDMLLDVLHDK